MYICAVPVWGIVNLMLTYFCDMMNNQLAFVKSGLGLALCFMMVGAGVTPSAYASTVGASVSANQQARTVTGTVTDQKGEPLLGVNVVVKGTTNGTVTDMDGKIITASKGLFFPTSKEKMAETIPHLSFLDELTYHPKAVKYCKL